MQLRFATPILVAALLLFGSAPANSQYAWMPAPQNDLSGNYVTDNGKNCRIYWLGPGYLFVDDAGQQVPFAYIGTDQLRSVPAWGMQVPDIVVTVGQNSDGRTLLRFDAAGAVSRFWVRSRW